MKILDFWFLFVWVAIITISVFINLSLSPSTKMANNPIYSKLENYSITNDWDFKFSKELIPGSDIEPEKLNIFTSLDGEKYDILLIGDSSVNYGIYYSLLENLTHKKIAILTYPALTVTSDLLLYIEEKIHHILKPNALVLFMFDPIFWEKGVESRQENRVLDKLISSEMGGLCIYCQTSLDHYRNQESVKSWFDEKSVGFGLFKFNFYNKFIEPFINPVNARKKEKNRTRKEKNEKRYLLDKSSVLIIKSNPNKNYQLKNNQHPLKSYKYAKNLNTFFSKISHKVLLIIPIVESQKIYNHLINITTSLNSFTEVIDLTLKASSISVDMQNRTHTANLGIVVQTHLLAEALNEHTIP